MAESLLILETFSYTLQIPNFAEAERVHQESLASAKKKELNLPTTDNTIGPVSGNVALSSSKKRVMRQKQKKLAFTLSKSTASVSNVGASTSKKQESLNSTGNTKDPVSENVAGVTKKRNKKTKQKKLASTSNSTDSVAKGEAAAPNKLESLESPSTGIATGPVNKEITAGSSSKKKNRKKRQSKLASTSGHTNGSALNAAISASKEQEAMNLPAAAGAAKNKKKRQTKLASTSDTNHVVVSTSGATASMEQESSLASIGNTQSNPVTKVAKRVAKKKPRVRNQGKSEAKNASRLNCRDYLKKFALFQCENDRDHTWKSAHGWKNILDEVFCDICENRAAVTDMKDEMCSLAIFVCPCGEQRWASMKDEGGAQQVEKCEVCLADVPQSGVQERNATHFWYKCSNHKCATEWEDACVIEKFSQRCKRCFGAGKIVGARKETETEKGKRIGMMKLKPHTCSQNAGHDIDGCDMCQKFIGQGKKCCTRFKKVEIDYELDEAGTMSCKLVNWA